MRKLVTITAVSMTLVSMLPVPARAGAAIDAALGLGAFAVFTQLFGAFSYPLQQERVLVVRSYPVVYAPPVYVTPPPVYAPPAVQREVVYPHGRYMLEGDGVTVAYRWVWIPNPPPPPPAPPPPPGDS